MGDIPVDAQRVVDELRAARRSAAITGPRTWTPSASFDSSLGRLDREPIAANDHLNWMHQNWDLRALLAPPRQPGLKGLARRIAHRASMAVLAPYLNQLQDYLGVTLRAIDAVAQRVDEDEADQRLLLKAVRTDMVEFAQHVDEHLDG